MHVTSHVTILCFIVVALLLFFEAGLPSWLSGKESTCHAVATGDQLQSLGWEDTLEKGMATHSSIHAWRIHGQRILVDYTPWGHKE